jgi:oxygen-dependent protoporphyrinogen oxidase
MAPYRVVVIGGGIAGLSAAFYIRKLMNERQLPVALTVIEKGSRIGGKISTLHKEGFIIERGPDSLLARKSSILELSRHLGMEQEMVGTNPSAVTGFIYSGGKLHPLPPALAMGVPAEWRPLLATSLLTPLGKARTLMEILLPKRKETGDESLRDFLMRRFGRQWTETIAEPALAGIYEGSAQGLSLRAIAPRLDEMEQTYRSLILGVRAQRKGAHGELAFDNEHFTYKQGLGALVERLCTALSDEQLLTHNQVVQINKKEGYGGYEIRLARGEELHADAIVLAVAPQAAARLLPNFPYAAFLSQILYVPLVSVSLSYRNGYALYPFTGSGFHVSGKERLTIATCRWTSELWPHTAPKDMGLLKVYIGRSESRDPQQWSDVELIRRVREDLQATMGIKTEPHFYEINRLTEAMPLYPLGHVEKLHKIRRGLSDKLPGIELCGAGYDGLGIPDCIRQGLVAARNILTHLTHASGSGVPATSDIRQPDSPRSNKPSSNTPYP